MNNILIKKSNLVSNNIEISGYKHSLVSLVALSVSYNCNYEINNVPDIEDTHVLISILRDIGKKVEFDGQTLKVFKSDIIKKIIPNDYSKKIHGSLYLIPAMLGINNIVNICESGGCKIGEEKNKSTRPVNHMIEVMERFGAKFYDDKITGTIGKVDKYRATTIDIMDFSIKKDILTGPYVSGATKTAIICASTVATGKTYIKNPYLKPDVTELLEVMSKLGFIIEVSKDMIIIQPPVKRIVNLVKHYLISDVTQIITYISLSVYCDVPLTLSNITVDKVKKVLSPELSYMQKMGIKIKWLDNSVYIPINNKIKSTNIEVYSTGIYSDSQPFFTLMLLKADNKSIITEYVWKNRFNYALEMNKLGAKLEVKENSLYITNKIPKKGGELIAQDLRAAATLIISALPIQEEVRINGIKHLNRGYDKFFYNLKKLGVNFEIY